MFEKLTFVLIFAINAISCTTTKEVDWQSQHPGDQPTNANSDIGSTSDSEQRQRTSDKTDVESLYDEGLKHIDDPIVQKWIKYFSESKRPTFQAYMDRGQYFRKYIEAQLEKNNLPQELYYLAMIESGYRIKARSSAQAVGLWQFIKPTGKRYGLDVEHNLDSRMNPVLATEAAILYLKDLYRVYQSWWLVMASYNSGEFRVLNAIMSHNTRNYFELIGRKALPPETRNYVPKFIAAMYIGENSERFGFETRISKEYADYDIKLATLPKGAYLSDLAKQASCPFDELKHLNPHIKGLLPKEVPLVMSSQCTPSDEDTRLVASLGQKRIATIAKTYPSGRTTRYRVRQGDSLWSIAKKFNIKVAQVRKLNQLESNHLKVGQILQVAQTSGDRNLASRVHKVRSGENLYLIAQKYRTSVAMIKKINNLRHARIQPGQLLRL